MKIKSISLSLLCSLGFVTHGLGQVPSLINYQGRLADGEGSPISGERGFTINIYDAQENGSVLYSEDIGQVTLDQNGVYSFQFGGNGTSTSSISSLVGVTDGVRQSFTTELTSQPINGSLSISDGTSTWSQASGPGNPPIFGGYDSNTNSVSAFYFQGVPDSGKLITTTYKTESAGITEALATGTEHWMELSIGGEVQQTRQRVLAVPFAAVAGKVLDSSTVNSPLNEKKVTGPWFPPFGGGPQAQPVKDYHTFVDVNGFKKLIGIRIRGWHWVSNDNFDPAHRLSLSLLATGKWSATSRQRVGDFSSVYQIDRGFPSEPFGNKGREEYLDGLVIPVDIDIQDQDGPLKITLSWNGDSSHQYNLENPTLIFE